MTSKNFKSTVGGFSIGIHSVKDGVQFRITNMRGNYQQFTTPSSVAAEQALAILEAAGYKDASSGGVITGARMAVGQLKGHVEVEAKRTAEAEAQAKLEAEALELRNAWALGNCAQINEFSYLTEEAQENWLAVARRARELNKEEK